MARPRRALVLSGGGAKGSFQIGVLEVLTLDRGLDFDIFCGVSVGALNAACLAQAQAPSPLNEAESLKNLQAEFEKLRAVWLDEIKGNSAVFSRRFGSLAGVVAGADSLYDSAPLGSLLDRHLDRAKLKSSNRDLRIQYVSCETGALKTVNQTDPDILKHVLASSSMPFLFPPVVDDEEHLVDGGLRDITPLGQAFHSELAPAEIYVVFASPFKVEGEEFRDNWAGTKVNGLTYLKRAVDILTDEIYQNDVEGAELLNTVKANWVRARDSVTDSVAKQALDDALANIRVAAIYQIRPEKAVFTDALDFDPVRIHENYEYGKAVARARFPATG